MSALSPYYVYADEPDYTEEMEERKNEPVDTNDITGWPDGPIIGAEAAILMDADTGEILYAKNIDEKLFPASTTKIMTCLVGIENANLNDLVTISNEAIYANEADGSNMGLKAGEQLTVEELLYGILITSANEACNALGEHISGSMEGYVELMNQRAAELGCTNTNFVTTNANINNLFKYDNKLTTIISSASTPSKLKDNTFSTLPTLGKCKLTCPSASTAAYKKADGWKHLFATTTGIEEIESPSNDTQHPSPVFSTNGTRLSAPRKGINIIGGKKVLVK